VAAALGLAAVFFAPPGRIAQLMKEKAAQHKIEDEIA
jgi:hypothetical protein